MPDGTDKADASDKLARFTAQLKASGFTGDIADDIGTRAVFATDNSVYELHPLAVVFPREPDDLSRIARASSAAALAITPRGGGTGTNGQSLTDRICVDCSRYLTQIEEINATERYAIVQPGVILDQLNQVAGKHGLFFAPTVSTASRATLGGMAATDASGKGSRIYGRTSDHVLSIEAVLPSGAPLHTDDATDQTDQITKRLAPEIPEITRTFPVMNRGLTGYNLQDAAQGSLIKLLCGSEGTLALTKRLKLRLLPKPKHKALVVFAYSDMMQALRDVPRLVTADPAAIEFIDDKILTLAQQDPVWESIAGVLDTKGTPVKGLNFAEVIADTPEALQTNLNQLTTLKNAPTSLIQTQAVSDAQTIAELWQLRSKCVGLLGRMDPTRQGTPFVEDAAVPAERLADFVEGFRDILDAEGLQYGMFGHADVGCVHVRPALDMRKPEDAAMIRKVSDQVNALALQHKGLIWGEHGKGFRGEYGPSVYGARLYQAMCDIKAMFDPLGLLNPGKIAMPSAKQPLTALDAVPFRGPLDAQISPVLSEPLALAIKCNGNGQCMGRAFEDAMCPSYKATGDRTKTPKARAVLLRNWARMQSQPTPHPDLPALEAKLHESLSDCLGCKACASSCPVKVDIPKMRSHFYARYYETHKRPRAHHLLSLLEPLAPLMRLSPAVTNAGMRSLAPMLKSFGLVDLPKVQRLRRKPNKNAKVILIADSFLATFDTAVLHAAQQVFDHLGYKATISKPLNTGKPAHVLGRTKAFDKTARKTITHLKSLQEQGAQLIALEPAFAAMFASEYADLGIELPQITPIDQALLALPAPINPVQSLKGVSLFTHCTETSADPQIRQRWSSILQRYGIPSETPQTGCCGMAGTFGHEAEKQAISKRLFDLSWREKIDAADTPILATGFSCRCQVQRFSDQRAQHPIEALRDHLLGPV